MHPPYIGYDLCSWYAELTMPNKSNIMNYLMAAIGGLAITGILGSLKLYSDFQVHVNSAMHAGADKRFDLIERRIEYVENKGQRNDDYADLMFQIISNRTRITLPSKAE